MSSSRPSPTRLVLLLAAVALGIVMLLWASGTIPPVTRNGPPLLLIAHRGDTRQYPENSLRAITSARDSEADGIEFDVQRSADGTWWVFHDDTVDRLTDGTGPFGHLTDGEAAELALAGTDERPPRLREVIAALERYSGWVYMDVKEIDPAKAVSALEEARSIPHLRVIVRTVQVAEAIRHAFPEMDTLALSAVRGQDISPFVTTWLANHIEVTRPDVVQGHHRPVDAFIDHGTHDIGGILSRLGRYGVRAVITSLPR